MTARKWKIFYTAWRIYPHQEWSATLISDDKIIVTTNIDSNVSKETAEEIVEQFAGKTAEDAAG